MIAFNRRQVVSGIGAGFGAASLGLPAAHGQSAQLTWRLAPVTIPLGGKTAPIWGLDPAEPVRRRLGDTLVVDVVNELPVNVALAWRGLDGVAPLVPLATQPPLAAGARARINVPLRRAGTLLCDFRLLGDGQARPLPTTVVVVDDAEPLADRDEVLLFEEWRLSGDNTALAPATSSAGATPVFTVNGRAGIDVAIRANERLRLRLVNGCQRSTVAAKIEGHAATVVAIDGAPAEPFPARDGEIILTPGSRIDVVVDGRNNVAGTSLILLHDGVAPRPIARLVYDHVAISKPRSPAVKMLPTDALPERLDLQRALRVELPFDGSSPEWWAPGALNTTMPAAFRVRRGRVVVATLTNRAKSPAVFHLHGHHARLLDRLDDGWKPFWLDTIAVSPGQTQRIAFLTDTAGSWLIEGMLTQWSAPRLARWFAVEA